MRKPSMNVPCPRSSGSSSRRWVRGSAALTPANPSYRWSLPELGGGDSGSFGQRCELRPDHRGVNLRRIARPRREPAVGSGDHVLASDDSGVVVDVLGDELRMFYVVVGMTEQPRDQ